MNTATNDWEFWLDENISPIISKWLMDEVNFKCISFHQLQYNQTPDLKVYQLARQKRTIVIISKDSDFREIVAWKGSPPKLIALEFGNCSNKELWYKLRSKIFDAIDQLIFGDLDIFDIK